MIRVLVADDHHLVRAGLEQLLATAEDIELVATAVDGEDAARAFEEHRPDVVLMDLSMPVLDGVAATGRILAIDAEARIVVLTSFSDDRRIMEALRAGATGYLMKDARAEELIAAIRAAAEGGAPLDPRAARVMLDSQRLLRPTADLSERETAVLRLVAEGLANKLIARRLGISERTVKAHLTSVFQRLGVSDRTQAALWAQEHLAPE
ncbi:MAG: hypothetical protein QOE35_3626 [Actinomycetota bacterium]|jgi:DNA-binding NarL/FixJ family response regulator